MNRNPFGSFFKKNEPAKPTLPPTPPTYTGPKIKTIATLEAGFPEEGKGWVEFHRLDTNYDFFQIKLQLFLATYAEIIFQTAGLEEGPQLTNYLRDITSYFLDSELSLDKRINILGKHLELLLAPPNNIPPLKKITTLLQITIPGDLVSTDFLFNCDTPKVFLPTCTLLILQDLIYTVTEPQLRKLFKAIQAMDAFYQTVKEPNQPEARQEAPAYALRSIV